jgi:hypothetical protein
MGLKIASGGVNLFCSFILLPSKKCVILIQPLGVIKIQAKLERLGRIQFLFSKRTATIQYLYQPESYQPMHYLWSQFLPQRLSLYL